MNKLAIFSGVLALLVAGSVSAGEKITVTDGLIDQYQDHGNHNSQHATIGFISDLVHDAEVNVNWAEIIQVQHYGHHNEQEAKIGFAGSFSNNAKVNVWSGAVYQTQHGGHKNTQTAKIGVVN